MALLGVDLYRAWIDALIATGQITRSGNLSLTVLESTPLIVGLSALAVVAAVWAILADERRGFVAAMLAALLVAPFTLMYQVSILLVVVRPALAVAPRATRVPRSWRTPRCSSRSCVDRRPGRSRGTRAAAPAASPTSRPSRA